MRKTLTIIPIALLLTGCAFLNTPSQSNPSTFSSESAQLSSSSAFISSDISNQNESINNSESSYVTSSSSNSQTSSPEEKTVVLDFYNFNDFHGSIEQISTTEPGIAKISTYLKQEKAKNSEGFVLTSSGDMWQGSALSNTFKGAIVNDWMNYVGFDCMTLGNHEFDWGVDRIVSNMKDLNFPVINCNIQDKTLKKTVDWIEGTAMKEVNGVNIGFVGAIGEGQTSDILASISYNLEFPDPSKYAIDAANELRNNGADLVVYLLHDSNETVTTEVASNMDVIFCGHTHEGEKKTINGVPALQAYSNGKDVSHVKLTYNTATKQVIYNTYEVVDLRRLSVTPDQGAIDLINNRLTPEISATLNAQIGKLNSSLSTSKLAQLMTEYLYKYYKDEYDEYALYATNHNNPRSSLPSGTISYKDIFKSFPFENEVVVMKIKGSALETIDYGTWYYPGSTSINNNTYYYIFTIDYIADYDYYYQPNLGVEIVRRYSNIYPRDIFARYFAEDYPL